MGPWDFSWWLRTDNHEQVNSRLRHRFFSFHSMKCFKYYVTRTCSLSSSGVKNVRLWKLASAHVDSRDIQQLNQTASFKQRDSAVFVNCVKWHNLGSKPQVLMIDPVFLTLWTISEAETKSLGNVDLSKGSAQVTNGEYVGSAASWDPHSPNSCAATSGRDLRFKLGTCTCIPLSSFPLHFSLMVFMAALHYFLSYEQSCRHAKFWHNHRNRLWSQWFSARCRLQPQ